MSNAGLWRRQVRATEQFRHAQHTIHRCSQLVAHPVHESLFRLDCFGQLRIALTQFARPQGNFGLESLLLTFDPTKSIALQPNPISDYGQHRRQV